MKQLILIALSWAAIFAAFLFALSIGAKYELWKLYGLIVSIIASGGFLIALLGSTLEQQNMRHIEFKDELNGVTREDEIY